MYPRQSQARNLSNTRSITNLRTVFPPPQQTVTINSTPQVLVRPPTASLRKTASPIRISQAPTLPPPPLINDYQIQQPQPIQSVNSASRHNITAHKYNQEYEDRPVGGLSTNHYGESDTNASTSKKGKYKYNFFSALDEAVNTQCGSCGAN